MTAPWDAFGLSLAAWEALGLPVRLGLAAALHAGWAYGAGRFPYRCGAIPSNLVDPEARTTNCTTFATALLSAAYPSAAWTSAEYAELQLFEGVFPARPLAPLDAVERVRVGVRVSDPVAGSWHLAQGWRTLGVRNPDGTWKVRPSGHGFLVRAGSGDSLTVLQATNVGANGPTWTPRTWPALRTQYKAAFGLARLLEGVAP